MRAYLRVDPNLSDNKNEYPDGAFRAYIEVLCHAEQQPKRGRFRSKRLLAVLLERRSRWIPYLIEAGDLILFDDGKLYVDGWDEWQEGDVTVSERMKRLRSRHKGDTPTDTAVVTVPTVTGQHAVGGRHLAEAVGASPSNGSATFMGFPPKRGAHEGQHPDCLVCAPLRKPA